jgi:hypothetical protein
MIINLSTLFLIYFVNGVFIGFADRLESPICADGLAIATVWVAIQGESDRGLLTGRAIEI